MTATLTAPPPLTTAAPGHVRLDAGPADIAALNDIVRDGAQAGHEHPAGTGRLNQVIPKPWATHCERLPMSTSAPDPQTPKPTQGVGE